MVTSTMRAQLQRVNDPAGVMILLTLQHPAIATVRVVNDTRDWTIGSDSWIGLPFRFRLPAETRGQAARAVLEVDNVGGALGRELDGLPAGIAMQATMRLVSRARPDVAEWEFAAPLSSVLITTTTLTASVGNDDAFRSPAVKVRYDPQVAPGLFAG